MTAVTKPSEHLAHLFVNLLQELELLFQSLSSVLGVDVKQRLVVEVLDEDKR